MISAGYLRKNSIKDLEHKAWNLLAGSMAQNEGVTGADLMVFTAAVMNICMLMPDHISENDEKGLVLSESQVTKIHKEFYELYTNKNSTLQKLSYNSTRDKENGPSFTPALCEQSLKMAASARGRQHFAEGCEDHASMLIRLKEQQERHGVFFLFFRNKTAKKGNEKN